jgi:hypothetical protein
VNKLFFLFFLMSGAYVGAAGRLENNSVSLERGLYYGKRGGLFPPVLAYVIVGETTVVEMYQPMKGEVFGIIKEVLHPTGKEKGLIFSGKETGVFRKRSSWYLTQIGEISRFPDFEFKNVKLEPDSTKASELNGYRKRAHLFIDMEKIVIETKEIILKQGKIPAAYAHLKDKYEGNELDRVLSGHIYSDVLRFEREFGSRDLSESSLSYEEFLIEYSKIRKKIIQKIVRGPEDSLNN